MSTIILNYVNRGCNCERFKQFHFYRWFSYCGIGGNVLSSNYQQMTKELQDKIEANTLIMQRLIDKLDHDELLKDGAKNDDSNNK